jgi:S1-C subfamily serine protease
VSTLRTFASTALLAAAALAQRQAPADEFLRLEPALQQALAVAAPFTVTVETFGGTRRAAAQEGPMDGEAPPKPRPMPDPKPDEEKPPDPEKGDPEKGRDEQPKKPLVAPGFAQTQGRTTGVILTTDGWIAVSRFALALEPTTVLITVPGRGTFHAVRGGEDTSRGIALVKIDARDLPVPELVAPEEVRVGQWAFALGRTFAAVEPTVHLGIVSAKQRLFGRALQIDAYTSPANYGGPVVDLQGRVLGIAVPLSPSGRNAGVEWYDSGIGFAATLADIGPLLARMRRGEVLQRGWLGVRLVGAHLGPGARVDELLPGSAGAKAGLIAGDVIEQVDGVAVLHGPHFQMLVSSRLGGDQVTLAVRRASGELETIGPITLLDTPWAEQLQKQEPEVPASFPVPQAPEGR